MADEFSQLDEEDLRLILMILGYMIGAFLLAIVAFSYFSVLHFASVLLSSLIILYFFLAVLSPSIYRKWKDLDNN